MSFSLNLWDHVSALTILNHKSRQRKPLNNRWSLLFCLSLLEFHYVRFVLPLFPIVWYGHLRNLRPCATFCLISNVFRMRVGIQFQIPRLLWASNWHIFSDRVELISYKLPLNENHLNHLEIHLIVKSGRSQIHTHGLSIFNIWWMIKTLFYQIYLTSL